MNLAELPFTGEQRRLVADLEALHSPLDVCAFSYSDAADEQALARRAAVEGMRVFHRRYVERLRHLNPGRDVRDLVVEWLAGGEEPTGRVVSLEEFLGDGFVRESASVDLYPGTPNGGEFLHKGLVYALINPPYGLFPGPGKPGRTRTDPSARRWETDLLFRTLDVLGIDTGPVRGLPSRHAQVIHRWSDDWSAYFEPGKQWWGTFFWTVLLPRQRRALVIGASSTD